MNTRAKGKKGKEEGGEEGGREGERKEMQGGYKKELFIFPFYKHFY
jgi:hypothetical protein